MALSVLRLRRALSPLSASLIKHRFRSPAPILCSISEHHLPQESPSWRPHQLTQILGFRSSAPLSDRRFDSGENKISPDEILFEGCDYNHWLITMDFPDDPKPTAEQMVETYVETLAKVVGSREEAMKRMYACSTTTYTGFQAVMTEEMSEKFRGLPGVVFILPDSYIDPVNKEYGGDKYEMGKITPRPPPVQYGRQGRYNDRNRNYDRPRYDRSRENVQMQGNRHFDNQGGYGQGDGRNYPAPQHNYAASQRNYNPMGQPGASMGSSHGSMQGQGLPHTPPPGYNPAGQQANQPFSPPGAAGYHPVGQQTNQPYGPQGAATYNPVGQQANQPYGPQGAATYNPVGQQANQPYGQSASQSSARSYSPPNNDPRGNSGFPPSTGFMNNAQSSGQYGSRPQNPTPQYQPQGGFVQGHESGNSNNGSASGGYHRQGPGYSYGQQNPGSEGYTGFNNPINPGKGQGQN